MASIDEMAVPTDLSDSIQSAINGLEWKFAKTMANIPHWYTVRDRSNPEKDDLYHRLVRYIADNCYVQEFYRRKWRYCNIGEYMYWIDMIEDENSSKLINRTLIDEEERKKYARG